MYPSFTSLPYPTITSNKPFNVLLNAGYAFIYLFPNKNRNPFTNPCQICHSMRTAMGGMCVSEGLAELQWRWSVRGRKRAGRER